MFQDAGREEDFLYGGGLDIAAGGSGQIPLTLIRAAALFYDAIIVPDGYFVCEGPLFRHLHSLFEDPAATNPNDEILTYLQRGIIRPNLRLGKNIADVWFNGFDEGVKPGEYLIVPAALGDPVFKALSAYQIPHVNWPEDMRAAKTTEFGQRLDEVFLSGQGAMNLVDAEAVIRKKSRDHVPGWGSVDARRTRVLIENFSYLLEENRRETKFRRGQIENFIAEQLEPGTKFSYGRLYASRTQDMPHAFAASLMESVSTVYELYQADKFACVPQLYHLHNPIISTEYLNPRLKAESEFRIQTFDLCSRINLKKLGAADILVARDLRTVGGDSLLEKAIRLRRAGLSNGGEDLLKFLSFCSDEYIPKLLETFPKARHAPMENVALGSFQRMSDTVTFGSATAWGVLWLLGDTPIGASLGLEALAAWLSSAPAITTGFSTTSLGTRLIKKRAAVADRWLTAHRSHAAASRLAREVNNLHGGPSN